jgi:hypothetical protein
MGGKDPRDIITAREIADRHGITKEQAKRLAHLSGLHEWSRHHGWYARGDYERLI